MTPTQREAAARLAEGPRTSGVLWARAVVSLLRELAAAPQCEPDDEYRCGGPRCDGNCCQPVREPVAWCSLTPSGKIAYFDGKPMVMPGAVGNEVHRTPLYAHPPQQRKPLTHMQAVLLWGHRSDGPSTAEIVSFARAIEKAHGIVEEA